jgi:hypothetical protein
MIQEAYVSFETAKLLKEKGFDENTLMVYMSYGDLCKCNRYDSIRNSNYNDITKNYFECTAPTHQMAIAWLRKKYNIYISIQPDFQSDKDYKICWCCSVNILYENCISTKWYQCYIETYEEATETAIKYCLEHLI